VNSNRKLFIVILAALILGLVVPMRQSWGAPPFQTVPTAGPSPTQRPTTAAPTQTSPPATNTSATGNTPRPTSSSPTRTQPFTTVVPTDTGLAITVDSSTPATLTLTPSATAVLPSETFAQAIPSETAASPQTGILPTQIQPLQGVTPAASGAQETETTATQAGTNWLPLVILLLVLAAGGIWLVQKRQAVRKP
jgi:hypothetical protein